MSLSEAVDPIVASYSAGLFDGEGSIHIGGATDLKLQVQIGISHLPVLEWFAKHWGGQMYEHPPDRRVVNASRYWTLSWGGKAARERLLRGMLPYLIIKRRPAELALIWLETVGIPKSFRKRETIEAVRAELRAAFLALGETRQKRVIPINGVSTPPSSETAPLADVRSIRG